MPIPSQRDEALIQVLADRLAELGEDVTKLYPPFDGWGSVLPRGLLCETRIGEIRGINLPTDERARLYAWILSILREGPTGAETIERIESGTLIPVGFQISRKTWEGVAFPSGGRVFHSVFVRNAADTIRAFADRVSEVQPDQIYDRRGIWQHDPGMTSQVVRTTPGMSAFRGIRWCWYRLVTAYRDPGRDELDGISRRRRR